MDINEAITTIQNSLDNGSHVIYIINPDGSTFTLKQGCMLLDVDNSHMPILERGVKYK